MRRATTERVPILARDYCRCFGEFRVTLRITFARSLQRSLHSKLAEDSRWPLVSQRILDPYFATRPTWTRCSVWDSTCRRTTMSSNKLLVFIHVWKTAACRAMDHGLTSRCRYSNVGWMKGWRLEIVVLVSVMEYEVVAIKDADVPQASSRIFQHLLKTYASEVNKLNSVWNELGEDDLSFKPHPRSNTVGEIMEHELLSERRFFAEFLGLPEVPA